MKKIKTISLAIFCSICLVHSGVSQDPSDGDIINQLGNIEIQDIQGAWGEWGDLIKSTTSGIEGLSGHIEIAEDLNDLYNATQALDSNECVPDFTTDARAMMPSSCMSIPDCVSCYEGAINNLSTIRKSLGRLSCIHSNTKTFKEAAIAFGDNVSGIHGALGIAWQYERKGIMDEWNKFKRSYDKKYVELMKALERNLKSIGECEQQFGMEDWYGRFGFIYFEMMKEKYKRTE